MRHLFEYQDFQRPLLEYQDDYDHLMTGIAKEVDSRHLKRFLLHISDPKNRQSIEEEGLIPKMPGKKWGKGLASSDYWSEPSIFATIFDKDSIDVYDVKNISHFVFPLAGIGDTVELDFAGWVEKMGMQGELERYDQVMKHPKHRRSMEMERWGENAEEDYNEYLMKNAVYDIWLIDREEVPDVKWYEDEVHYESHQSVLTTDEIPPDALELISMDNKPKVSYREN